MSSTDKPLILIDENEAREEKFLLQYLQEHFGRENVIVQPELLTDFSVFSGGKERPIERKRFPSDFLASVRDGRLGRQCAYLSEQGGALLLEGGINLSPDGRIRESRYQRGFTFQQVTGLLMTIQNAGIQVLWSPTIAFTPHAIEEAYRWWGKTGHSNLMRRPGPHNEWGMTTRRDKELHAIQGFGVGPGIALTILKHLGGVRAFLDADEAALIAIPGIGKAKARKILELRDN